MRNKVQRRRRWLLAGVVMAVASAFLTIPTMSANADPANVCIKDNPTDPCTTPSTPYSSANIWSSPDIIVCASPAPCTSDTSVTPGTTYYLDVTLRNAGGTVSGTLSLFVTNSAMVTTPTSPPWTNFSNVPDTLTTGAHTLIVPWTAPSSITPGQHFCLMAYWTSPTDLVTSYPASTSDQVWFNRNVAQHNVVMTNPWTTGHVVLPVEVRGATVAGNAGLAILPSGTPFVGPGTLVIDLGQTLTQRWLASGAQGKGIERVGTTQLQVTDPAGAQVLGLALKPGEDFPITLNFGVPAGSAPTAKLYTEELVQTDSQGNVDGGVEYRLTPTN
jgi:hypothetical protein